MFEQSINRGFETCGEFFFGGSHGGATEHSAGFWVPGIHRYEKIGFWLVV